MYIPQILEVTIGLIFLYLALGLLTTSLNEILSRLVGLRADTLFKGIGNLFEDNQELLQKFYNHPLINSLKTNKVGKKGKNNPSYIPARTFAMALLDTTLKDEQAEGTNELPSTIIDRKMSDVIDGLP